MQKSFYSNTHIYKELELAHEHPFLSVSVDVIDMVVIAEKIAEVEQSCSAPQTSAIGRAR
jgi:hypothetical protein